MPNAPSSVSEEPVGPIAAAEHIAMAGRDLRAIAGRNGHAFLAYLIDMAALEATRIANDARQNSGRAASAGGAEAFSEGTPSGPDDARRAPPDRAPEE